MLTIVLEVIVFLASIAFTALVFLKRPRRFTLPRRALRVLRLAAVLMLAGAGIDVLDNFEPFFSEANPGSRIVRDLVVEGVGNIAGRILLVAGILLLIWEIDALISTLTRQQTELDKTAQQLNDAQAVGNVGFFEFDYDAQRLWWSDSAYRRLGYEPGEIPLTLVWLSTRIHPEDVASFLSSPDAATPEAPDYELFFRIRDKRGRWRDTYVQGHCEFDDSGRLLRRYGINQDHTDIIASRRAAERSLETLMQAQSIGKIGSWAMDVESRAFLLSAECVRLLESPTDRFEFERLDDFLAGLLDAVVHPDDRERGRDLLTGKLRATPELPQEELEFEARLIRPGTSTKHTLHRVRIYRDRRGLIREAIGVVVDLTEQKQAEVQLRASQELTSSVFEALPYVAVVKDRDSRLLLTNRNFDAFYGTRLAGKHAMELPYLSEQEKRGFVESDRRTIESGQVVTIKDHAATRADGTTRYFNTIKVPLRDATGAVIGLVAVADDITLERWAGKALETSERKFRNLVEGSLQAIVITRDNRFLFVNQSAVEFSGYASAGELMELPANSFWAPEECARMSKIVEDRAAGRPVPELVELRLVRKDGAILHAIQQSRQIEWEDGSATQSVLIDVTGLRRAQQELLASEEKFRNLVEGSVEGIIIHDGVRPHFANQAAADIFAYPAPRDLCAVQSFAGLLTPPYFQLATEYSARRLKGESVPTHYQVEGTRSDGVRIWLELSARRVEWEGAPAIQLTMVEITLRKQAQEELRASQELLRTVFAALPSIAVVKDVNSRMLMTNDNYVKFFGQRGEGKTPADMPYAREEERARVLESDRETIRSGHTVEVAVQTVTNAQGEPRQFQTTKVPLRDRDANVIGLVSVAHDITLQEQAAAALAASEQRYRGLVEGSIQGILIFREDRVLFVNASAIEMFGYANEQDVLRVSSMELVAELDRERIRDIRRARLAGEPVPDLVEFTGLRKDGTNFTALATPHVIEWDGKPAVQATMVDISGRKRAEAELRDSERKYRDLVDGSTQAVVILRDAKVLFANQTVAEMLGYARIEDIPNGNPEQVLVHPEDAALVRAARQRVEHGQVAAERVTHRVVRPDHAVRWLDITIRRIDWDERSALQVTMIDVTDAHLAEQLLRESEERFRVIASTANDAIVLLDRHGKVAYWNPAAERMFGFTAEEVDRGDLYRLIVPKEIRKVYLELVSEFAAGNWEEESRSKLARLLGRTIESRGQRKDGSRFPVEVTVSMVFMRDGRHVAAFVRDISERRRMEELTGQYQRQMAQAGKMIALGELAAGIAHEVNNPLAIISSSSELLSSLLRPGGAAAEPDTFAKHVARIEQQVFRTKAIVDGLLNFARQDSTGNTLVNVASLVEEAIATVKLSPSARERGISLDYRPPPVSAAGNPEGVMHRVKAQPRQLQQVIINLLMNAIDASPQGGHVKLTVAAGEKEIEVTVKDFGHGIAKNDLARIFEPFFTTKPIGKGTGLGLYLSQQIVRSFGGDILVESRASHGTTMRVVLPIPAHPARALEAVGARGIA